MTATTSTAGFSFGRRMSTAADRRIKYLLIWPAVLILLLVAIFPLINLLVVSFQDISIIGENKSFQGGLNYGRLFEDARLWESIWHTLAFTAVALPTELVLGLLLALLFVDKMPGRGIFVALLVIPTVISPIVAGAMWRLMLDTQFGPVNQILSWIAGGPVDIGRAQLGVHAESRQPFRPGGA